MCFTEREREAGFRTRIYIYHHVQSSGPELHPKYANDPLVCFVNSNMGVDALLKCKARAAAHFIHTQNAAYFL